MKRFRYGHASHPQWRQAAGRVLEQLRTGSVQHDPAPLGLLYITDHYVAAAQEILDFLGAELPEVADWAGTVGVGIAATNVEYFDAPALAVMLCDLPSDQYRIFSGVAPLAGRFDAHAALIHADGAAPDLADLIVEMAARIRTGYLFGGLASSRAGTVQFALGGNGNMRGQGAAGGVFRGGLSGVAFGPHVRLVSRVTQGCHPVAPVHEVTAAQGNLLAALDGRPALDVLLQDLGVSLDEPQQALARVRETLVGLWGAASDSVGRTGNFGSDVVVRHIVGLDAARRGVAIADHAETGMRLAFCERDVVAARADLIRICAEVREEFEQESVASVAAAGAVADEAGGGTMAGAVYVSCCGRGGPHFGAPSAELQIVRRALGDVPLVGFFAGGEIARHHLYGYTGVLTVFGG
ncbi:MAG: hypothetical protein OJF60_000627 [Burkholderiaceae bacterium]|jgi:small ligand-binding sensory domain FIST|nr:MAG: hypothetical protein OJF60_000627 [Burkholderiaceae bacterium]